MPFWDKIKSLGVKKTKIHEDWDERKDQHTESLDKLKVRFDLKGEDFARKIDIWYDHITTDPKNGKVAAYWDTTDDQKGDLDKVYAKYIKALKRGISNASKHKNLTTEVKEAVIDILKEWTIDLVTVKSTLDDDFEKVRKVCTEMEDKESLKPPPKRVTILEYSNLSKIISKNVRNLSDDSILPSIPLKVAIEEKEVLKLMRNPSVQARAVEAANLKLMARNVCTRFNSLLKEGDLDDEDLGEELKKIVQEEAAEGYKRAIDKVGKLMEVNLKNYLIYKGTIAIKGVVAIAGIGGGAASLVFSGGASSVLGLYSMWKGLNSLVDELS